MDNTDVIKRAFEQGAGVFRLAPTFVPRLFGSPGFRLRLHPDDYHALGLQRGPIKERWLASTVPAENGPLAPSDEGMSHVAPTDSIEDKFSLKDAVATLGAELIGDELMSRYGDWPIFAKFFDYSTPLFHHLHLREEDAARVGKHGKPEAYYFPVQMNNHLGQFPVTYFGLDPDVTIDQVRERLLRFETDDNQITELSRAYRIILGDGWYVPAGVLHAPGSVLTYETQWAADVNSVYENVAAGEVYPYDFLAGNCPSDKQGDVDYILGLLEWDVNVDPHFRKNYHRPRVACSGDDSHKEDWITYGNPCFSAKELTVAPGASVVIKDGAAHGCVVIQGHGSVGVHRAEAAMMLRFGQLSADEFFVGEPAAKAGVRYVNESRTEPMVVLKHFGPNHPDAPRAPA